MRFFTASALSFVLTAGALAPALADDQSAQTLALAATPVQQTQVSTALGGVALTNTASSAPVDDVAADASSIEAEPTSGADVAMWNSSSPALHTPAAPKHDAPHRVASTALFPQHPSASITGLAAGIFQRTRELASRLTSGAMHFLGVPYVFGGTTTGGFDCSGYVQHVFAMFGMSLPRTADEQYLVGQHVAGSDMSRGDLVFFQTYTAGASHVGIYLGDGKFIHSGSGGVQVSSLRESYWSARYLGARHIIGSAKLFAGRTVN